MKKDWRIYWLLFFFIMVFAALGSRLFFIQVLKQKTYLVFAKNQQEVKFPLKPERGEIFIQDKTLPDNRDIPVALNKVYYQIYLVPKEIILEQKEEIAKKLSEFLNIEKEAILEKINKENDPYEPLKNKLEEEEMITIKKLNLNGVYFEKDIRRFYPYDLSLAHILGFVGPRGDKSEGLYGIEKYYEQELAGAPGFFSSIKDALGRLIFLNLDQIEQPQNGADLALTIERNIQTMSFKILQDLMEKYEPDEGVIIVQEPQSGRILALSALPGFDPNDYGKTKDVSLFLNPALQKVFEPGSVMKPFTMAAALDSGKITPQTDYVDEGAVKIGGYTIENALSRKYGRSTMTKVLEKSINTGAVFVQRLIGQEIFKKYFKKFGFDQLTGIDLPGEVKGNLFNLDSGREIDYAVASFGQGINVTPIKLISAFSAIANQGKMLKPYLVQKIITPGGEEINIENKEEAQVISSFAANQLTAMLVSTVKNGYDKVKIKNYYIAGKTGTAQIPEPDKKGYSDKTVHTFVGFGPAYNPRFIILIKLENPKGIRFASDSLGLPFSQLANFILNYEQIPPDIIE